MGAFKSRSRPFLIAAPLKLTLALLVNTILPTPALRHSLSIIWLALTFIEWNMARDWMWYGGEATWNTVDTLRRVSYRSSESLDKSPITYSYSSRSFPNFSFKSSESFSGPSPSITFGCSVSIMLGR